MRAIVIEAFGGPEVLRLREVARPPLEPDRLRVRLRACGVNRADVLLRKGAYHGAQPPARPGLEAAGVVEEAGAASGYAAGERVLLYNDRTGLYATEACPRAAEVCRIPDSVSFEDACALPVNGLTAWYCLERLIAVQPGESILVLAAASGVGTVAVQLAANKGARVLAAAGSPEKLALARSLGAAETIDYRAEDLVAAALAHTGGQGVDGVLDAVGGERFAQALEALGPFGRVASLANVTLEDSVVNTRDFYPKNASIHGFQLGRLVASGRWDPREAMEHLLAEVAAGRLKPVIDRTFPLADAALAHEHLESRRAIGKVLLLP